jgi:hypothetical protein
METVRRHSTPTDDIIPAIVQALEVVDGRA